MHRAAITVPAALFVLVIASVPDVAAASPGTGPNEAEEEPSDAPSLPVGLADEETSSGGETSGEPALPEGLGGGEEPEGPSLPEGLGGAEEPDEEEAVSERDTGPSPLRYAAFAEARGGSRIFDDAHQDRLSLAELRLHGELGLHFDQVSLELAADLLYDGLADDLDDVDLETGHGFVDLREAYIAATPVPFLDIRVGRQIITWGTGDLVFLNDLFPKDWRSFFLGRDLDYLKAPSDAIRASVYTSVINAEVIYTPRFDADRHITGERLSYYNAGMGERAGQNAIIATDRPDDWFIDEEWAWRAFRRVSGWELAAYGYWGFWKSPAGLDPASGRATFPPLSVYGASARGSLLGGITNLEAAYYDSRTDRDGDDPTVPNSEVRWLVGHERELVSNLTLGLQYYAELRIRHDAHVSQLPSDSPVPERIRHVATTRLTWFALRRTLQVGLFAFVAPVDADAWIRPSISYDVDDHWTLSAGGNLIVGRHPHTFFGQFERNSNVYLAVRYGL